MPVIGELELGWRLLPNRFVAVTGTNGKTTVAEWLGHVWREAGSPVVVAGNVGTPLASLAGALDADATGDLRVLLLPARGLGRLRARGRACCSTSPPTTSTATARFDAYLDAKLRIFANQTGDATAIFDADEPALAGVDIPGAGRRRPLRDRRLRRRATAQSALADGAIRDADGLLVAAVGAAAGGRAQPPQRDGGRRGRPRRRHRPRRPSPAGLRTFAGVPHRLERGRRDRRRHLRQRLEGDERRRRRGGARLLRRRRPRDPRRQPQGRRLRRAGPGRRRALPRLLPDRRGRGAPRRRPRRRPASR